MTLELASISRPDRSLWLHQPDILTVIVSNSSTHICVRLPLLGIISTVCFNSLAQSKMKVQYSLSLPQRHAMPCLFHALRCGKHSRFHDVLPRPSVTSSVQASIPRTPILFNSGFTIKSGQIEVSPDLFQQAHVVELSCFRQA